MQHNYLISCSADYIGDQYVPVTRIFNGSVVTCDPEEYELKCGERWADEKPTSVPDGELLYDMTN